MAVVNTLSDIDDLIFDHIVTESKIHPAPIQLNAGHYAYLLFNDCIDWREVRCLPRYPTETGAHKAIPFYKNVELQVEEPKFNVNASNIEKYLETERAIDISHANINRKMTEFANKNK